MSFHSSKNQRITTRFKVTETMVFYCLPRTLPCGHVLDLDHFFSPCSRWGHTPDATAKNAAIIIQPPNGESAIFSTHLIMEEVESLHYHYNTYTSLIITTRSYMSRVIKLLSSRVPTMSDKNVLYSHRLKFRFLSM